MSIGLSKAERTRNFIIEQAAEMFNKKGYAGTSISDLVEATGLTRGSIYGNFENKEEVALAAFDYNFSRISNTTRNLIERQSSYHRKLMVYAHVYKKMLQGKSRGGCPILNTAIEADDTNPALKQRAARAMADWENKVIFLIQEGIESGEFNPDVNAKKVACTIIAMIEGGMMIAKLTGNQKSFQLVLDSIELIIQNMETERPI